MRADPAGADLARDGSPSLTVQTPVPIYLMLPAGGDSDGEWQIDDGGGPLTPWVFTLQN